MGDGYEVFGSLVGGYVLSVIFVLSHTVAYNVCFSYFIFYLHTTAFNCSIHEFHLIVWWEVMSSV